MSSDPSIEPESSSELGRAPRDLTLLTRVLQVLLTAWGLIAMGHIALAIRYWFLLHDPETTDEVWFRQWEIQDFAAGVYFAVLLLIVPLFVRWLYVAHVNVRVFGARGLESTPVMAVVWYFVPLANLVKPYPMMRQLSSASRDPGAWQQQPCHRVVPWWWGAWVLEIAVATLLGLFQIEVKTFEENEVTVGLELLRAAMQLAVGVFAGILVGLVAGAQKRVLEAA